MNSEQLAEQLADLWQNLQRSGPAVLLILVTALAAFFIWEKTIKLIIRRVQLLDDVEGSYLDKRTATIGNVLHSAGIVVILGTAVLMILAELGVDITPVLASVGIVSLAAGLGAQTLVKDIISGMFILIENQYTVGDVIDVNGVKGTVEDMTLRITAVRDISGAVHIIPNGEIRQVANASRDWSRAMVDVSITYDQDVDRAVQALEAIASELYTDEEQAALLLEEPVVTGIEGLDDWAIRLRLMVKTKPGEQWSVQRWLRRRIRLDFASQGIELAFPRQDVMIVNLDEIKGNNI